MFEKIKGKIVLFFVGIYDVVMSLIDTIFSPDDD